MLYAAKPRPAGTIVVEHATHREEFVMARPAGVQRIVFGFTLPSGEVASTGYWTRINANTGTAQQVADAQQAIGSWANLLAAMKNVMGTTTSLTSITVYQYRTTAVAADDKGVALVTNGAGLSTVYVALPTALVCSLRSANATRSGRGRMYFPATGLPSLSSGLFDASSVDNLRVRLATYLSNRDVVVVSETRSTTYTVNAVQTDQRPDTMRSRNDKLRPAYTGTAVTNA